jgi:hypothetical protein
MNARPTGMPGLWRIRMRCVLRRFGCHRSAMRRPLDRNQTIIGFGLSLVFLVLGSIVAAGVFQFVCDAGAKAERHESATRHQVDAIVVGREVTRAGVSGQVLGSPDQVQWRAADGSRRTGAIDTGKRVGQHVTLWVDNAEAISRAPQNRTQTLGTAGFAGAGGLLAVAAPLALGYWVVRRRFDRRRFAEWTDEWALTSPRWTGRS